MLRSNGSSTKKTTFEETIGFHNRTYNRTQGTSIILCFYSELLMFITLIYGKAQGVYPKILNIYFLARHGELGQFGI